MFRGIDPQGLSGLASALQSETNVVRSETRIALNLLNRHGRAAEATSLAGSLGNIEDWILDTANTLRWRADVIRFGQTAAERVADLTRTRFASEAVFTIADIDQAYRHWVEEEQASKRRIAAAVTAISKWLGQSWDDWDVTNEDLHNIVSTLETLPTGELDRVLTELSPTQLERWITEMSNGLNGFSRGETQELFVMLAAASSGESLGRVHDAIVKRAMSEEATDFGMAIRHHTPEQTIVDFVRYAIDQDLAANRYSAVAPALAAGAVRDPTAIDTMTQGIIASETAIGLFVVDSLVTAHIEDTGRSCLEIDPWNSLVDTISRGTDAGLIADVFASIARSAVRSEASLGQLLLSRHGVSKSEPHSLQTAATSLLGDATRLLAADANGVIAQLATRLDPDGSLTTDFLHQLVDQNQIDQLGTLIRQLRGGAGVDVKAFADVGMHPDYPYPHAQNLGFFAASLRGALERYADDAMKDVNAIAFGAQAIGSVAALFYSAPLNSLQIAAGLLGWGAENLGPARTAADTNDDIYAGLAQLVEAIETNLQPQQSSDASPATLGEAMWAWDDRYDFVLGQ